MANRNKLPDFIKNYIFKSDALIQNITMFNEGLQ